MTEANFKALKKERDELKALNEELVEALRVAHITLKAFLPEAFATIKTIESSLGKIA